MFEKEHDENAEAKISTQLIKAKRECFQQSLCTCVKRQQTNVCMSKANVRMGERPCVTSRTHGGNGCNEVNVNGLARVVPMDQLALIFALAVSNV